MGIANPTPWFPPPPPRDDCCVNADQLAVRVDESPAGVAGIDGGIGLNEIFIIFDIEAVATSRADDPHGGGLPHTEWIADRKSQVAHLNLGRVAHGDCGQVLRIDPDDSQIRLGVRADYLALEFPFVGKEHLDLSGALDHVIVSENVAIRPHNHARSKALFPLLPGLAKPMKLIAEELLEEGVVEELERLTLWCFDNS
jgi:hypothetical protein